LYITSKLLVDMFPRILKLLICFHIPRKH